MAADRLVEAELSAAIARRRAAEAGAWGDQLLMLMVAAPLLGPAIEVIHWLRRAAS